MQVPGQRAVLLAKSDTLEYAVSDPLLGKTLGDAYRVDRRIAEGGMGVVYGGEQLKLGRPVAIKVLKRPLTGNVEAMARFKLEAELIARLGHPHIVQIIDIGTTEEGTPYIVMEYLKGETLLERLMRDGALPLSTVTRVVERLASALSATHRAGVIHRDIKPENVFLVATPGDSDFVKLLDFGIGKVVASGKNITESTVALGTPEYMAPEQATARSSVDHRADQYSLAAVTFTMLTGRPPIMGPTPQDVVACLVTDEPPNASSVKPGIPAAVDAVLSRALKKKPEERFSSVLEFQRALERACMTPSQRPTGPASGAPAPRATPQQSGRPSERQTKTAPGRRSTGATARTHLEAARAAAERNQLDLAVEHAEALLELGAVERDPVALDLLRTWLPTLDRIFRDRVGPLNRRVAPGALARAGKVQNISPRAKSLLDTASEGNPRVKELLEASGCAEREGVWLVAGLLRRKYLVLL